MNPLLALALATPIWGFSLQPPMALEASIAPSQVAVIAAVGDGAVLPPRTELEERIAHNDVMMDWTRGFQLTGALAMAITGVLGAIQFGDEYGFNSDYSQTACATGQSVMDYCGSSTPVPHLIGAATSALTGGAAFILSTQVDFDLAAERDGDWRTFETTRWIGLGMTVAQALLGIFMSNSTRFGWLDEQGDFDTLQGLAIGHLALGAAAIGVEVFNTALVF